MQLQLSCTFIRATCQGNVWWFPSPSLSPFTLTPLLYFLSLHWLHKKKEERRQERRRKGEGGGSLGPINKAPPARDGAFSHLHSLSTFHSALYSHSEFEIGISYSLSLSARSRPLDHRSPLLSHLLFRSPDLEQAPFCTTLWLLAERADSKIHPWLKG